MRQKKIKKIAFGDNLKVRFSVVRKVFYTFLHHKIFLILLGVGTLLFLSSLSPKNAYTQSSVLPIPIKYISLIQERINPCLIYPPEAIVKGWEGVVRIRFVLTRDGRIKDIDVAESSGYPLLDAAALLAVKDASPYPFPKDYTKKELEMILPINYQQDKPLKIIPLQKAALPKGAPKRPVPEEKPAPLKETKEELSYFLDLAIENNQPLKVARQEIELAQFKVIETQRNLFPNLKMAGYVAQGDVYKVDYEEWESRLELTQPLFDAGTLIDTVKQAKVNLEITQETYTRLKLELRQKTETAYYNLALARAHLKLKEALLQEAKEMLEKIEKLSAAGLVIPLEVNSAAAWFEQIKFQMDSLKRDVLMAELTLRQVLNIKETPQVQPPELAEVKKLDIDLSTCQEAALHYRPELHLSELQVKYNDYSQKIKRTEINAFTVDLVSSYGYYKGHYKNLPWEDTDNWFAGIKVSKPWGGSTINTSYNVEQTKARFGQTSPSRYSMVSTEFSLLDNLKRLSDKKKSDIDVHRSISDFDETLKTITFEVEDAFLNYQKAVLQFNAAELEIKFRRNETEVTKIRALVGETSLSNALETLYSLSEAQTRYTQALVNYQISLANLKKATGYGIKL